MKPPAAASAPPLRPFRTRPDARLWLARLERACGPELSAAAVLPPPPFSRAWTFTLQPEVFAAWERLFPTWRAELRPAYRPAEAGYVAESHAALPLRARYRRFLTVWRQLARAFGLRTHSAALYAHNQAHAVLVLEIERQEKTGDAPPPPLLPPRCPCPPGPPCTSSSSATASTPGS